MSIRRDQKTGRRLLGGAGERHAGLFLLSELTDPATGFPTFIYETWGDPQVPTTFFPLSDGAPEGGEVEVPSDEDLERELLAVTTLVGACRHLIQTCGTLVAELEQRDTLVEAINTKLTELETQLKGDN